VVRRFAMLAGAWVFFVAVCLGEEPRNVPGKQKGPEDALRAVVEARAALDAERLFDLLSTPRRAEFARLHELARKAGELQRNLVALLEATPEQIGTMGERDFAVGVMKGAGFKPPGAVPLPRVSDIVILKTTDLGDGKREIQFSVDVGCEETAVLVREGEEWRYESEELTCALLEELVRRAAEEEPAARSLTEKKNAVICLNNLRQIGGLLPTMQTAAGFERYAGPAFILQLVKYLSDEDLGVFLCPGESEDPAHPRPKPGSPEFVKMYRALDLKTETDFALYTSYAGPDWKSWTQDPDSKGPRLWACDRCRGGKLHHTGGLAVLYADSARVELLKPQGIRAGGLLVIGPDSPVELFRAMLFEASR
jgi:hypothetical protein